MAKMKKISVNAFEKAMKDTYTPTETFDWNGIEVTALKEGDTYYSLGFGAGVGYYGVTCTNGMDRDSLYGYLESLYNANKSGKLPIPD